MAYSLPLLTWLRTFEASARHLSFARAAEELGLTSAAVGQQIKALETHLGFALFERLPRGVRLSTIGRAYFPLVRRSLEDLSVATAGLFGVKDTRGLTIRCAVSFGALCLPSIVRGFQAAYPNVGVKIYSSIWSDDLNEDAIDLEIRYGDGHWDGFEVTPLSAAVSVPVCPPDAAVLAGDSADVLRQMAGRTINIVGLENLWERLSRSLGWPEGAIGPAVSVDTSIIALEMVAAGIGSALISRDLAEGHRKHGRVFVPTGIELQHEQTHHLLVPKREGPMMTEVMAFRDWIIKTLRLDITPRRIN